MKINELKEQPKLSTDEKKIVDSMKDYDHLTLDEIATATSFSLPKTASLLFNLEMSQIIRTLPGHLYQLINN